MKKKDGKTFQLDKNKNRIPLDYLEKVDVNIKNKGKNMHAYFYKFEKY